MRLHERTMPVNKARADFRSMIWGWAEERDLTYVELVGILLEAALDVKKYMLREERHPGEPDRKADEA